MGVPMGVPLGVPTPTPPLPNPSPPLLPPPNALPPRENFLLATRSLRFASCARRRSVASLPSLGTITACTRPGNARPRAVSSTRGADVTHRGSRLRSTVTRATDAFNSRFAYRRATRLECSLDATVSTTTTTTNDTNTTTHSHGDPFGRWCTVPRAKRFAS